ncbi:prefoldin subunit 5-like [Watersipora subatra]|uniref:prefoldin subunit 5-like n=1 Tax=Watersipora subatra TaxID=2589382 RepID=UPI00355B6D77
MASAKSSKDAPNAGGQVVDLSQLPIQQLNQLTQTLEKEVEYLQKSMQQMKDIQSRFLSSRNTLTSVNSENAGKEIMVPLTSSLYAAGTLAGDNKVLIDIGTGYYVEKTINEASLYFKRKMDFITKQIELVQPQLQEKYNMKQAAMEVLQMKVQAAMQQQQQQKA